MSSIVTCRMGWLTNMDLKYTVLIKIYRFKHDHLVSFDQCKVIFKVECSPFSHHLQIRNKKNSQGENERLNEQHTKPVPLLALPPLFMLDDIDLLEKLWNNYWPEWKHDFWQGIQYTDQTKLFLVFNIRWWIIICCKFPSKSCLLKGRCFSNLLIM